MDMDTSLSRALTKLPKGSLLRVPTGSGKGVAVFHGQAWVTQDGDPRDVLLGAGESFALDRPGRAIVQALADTSLLVFQTRPQGSSAVRGVDSIDGASQALRDTEAQEAEPPTSYELHRLAHRMRNDAIAEAARRLVGNARRLWKRA
jgi:Protein of unknown function (DUF2917)